MSRFSPEQKLAIETLDRNMVVKAGAGAGKTRVLAERYIRMLESGAADLDGIVAITFTRKAAREMKDRIGEKIRSLEQENGVGEFARRWRRLARKFDMAAISTIHSLCSRILREHPAEAGVDPEFALLDDLETDSLVQESWHGVLDRAAKTEADWLNRLLAVYSPVQVRQDFYPLFVELQSTGLIGSGLELALCSQQPRQEALSVERMRDLYLRVFSLIPAAGKPTATQARLKELQADWDCIEKKLERIASEPDVLTELECAWKGMRSGGELGEAIRTWKAAAEALRENLLDARASRLIPDFCELFRQVAADFEQAKKMRRVLTYDDLENQAEQLLREWPELCAAYSRRIRYIMVDECQDINERQRKIIYLLAGGKADELCGERLFVVGDLKQSIYRFRGADNRVFARVERDICSTDGLVVELLDNYRSHHGLIEAFNEFFSELMPSPVCEETEPGGLDAVEYRQLRGTQGKRGEERVEMWVLDGDSLSGADARDKEAEMIAGRIRELTEGAGSTVQYGDIAILLRAFSRIGAYEAALAKAGIPYYVAGGRGFAERQEVQDVLGLLRFLCNSCNDSALFGLLRSPFFLLSDEALLRLRQQGGSGGIWAALSEAASVDGLTPAEVFAAKRARALLGRWLELRGFLTPEELLREAFDATGFDLFQLTQLMGVRRYANLRKLLALAASFAATEAKGLAAFLQYAELYLQNEGEAEMDSETGNTVRIMTIHKSKGLEFPVVIVPDLQRRFHGRTQPGVFVRGYGLGLKVPDSQGNLRESGQFRRIAGVDAAMERAEMKRVLYVAMTRAERQIVLSAVAKRAKTPKTMQKASGWLDWTKVMLKLPEETGQWPAEKMLGNACLKIRLGMPDPAEKSTAAPAAVRTFPEPAGGVLPPEIRKNIAALSVGKGRPLVLSPAYLAEFAACPRSYFYSHIARLPDLPEPSGAGEAAADAQPLTGRLMGTAFHRVLELMNSRTEGAAALDRAVREKVPPELRATVANKLSYWLRQYRNSNLYADVCAAAEERREWAFQYRLLPVEDGLPAAWLSGQVDRVLFQADGNLGIVDYKTDWITAGELQQKAARYRLQLAGYALGAGAAFGREVGYARLYFARTGDFIAVDVSAEALLTARRELQEIAGFIRSHEGEAAYECRLSHCEVCRYRRICLQA